MQITLNGEPRELEGELTVAELLVQLKLAAEGTAVALNLRVVPRADQADRRLADGDRVDIVTAVGGG